MDEWTQQQQQFSRLQLNLCEIIRELQQHPDLKNELKPTNEFPSSLNNQQNWINEIENLLNHVFQSNNVSSNDIVPIPLESNSAWRESLTTNQLTTFLQSCLNEKQLSILNSILNRAITKGFCDLFSMDVIIFLLLL